MLASKITFLHKSASTSTKKQLIRNLFILGVSSIAWSSVKASPQHTNSIQPVGGDVLSSTMSLCSEVNNIPVVEYDEVKDLPNHPEKLLIDVREPNEIKETGIIPTAINIPLGIFGQELALTVNADQFHEKYGREKPDINTYIIMQCRSGRRSLKAAEIAVTLGYKNVHNYLGSWLDWAAHEGLPKESS